MERAGAFILLGVGRLEVAEVQVEFGVDVGKRILLFLRGFCVCFFLFCGLILRGMDVHFNVSAGLVWEAER